MCVAALALLDSDNAVLRYLAHSVSQQLTYFRIVVCADSSNLLYLVIVVVNLLSVVLDIFNNGSNGLVDTTLQVHRVCTCCNVLQSFSNNSLCKDSCCCCTVTCIVTSLACNALNKLCACVLKAVLKLNFLCYGHTVFCYLRSTEFFLNNNVAAFRTECHFHCICQLVNASLQEFAGVCIEFYFFSHDDFIFI